MSGITVVTQTSNQLGTNYDTSQFLLGFNSTIKGASSGTNTLLQGMVMGRVAATQKLVPMDKDATDGSQYPIGLCLIDQSVVADSVITLVNKGKVNESKINFKDVETLATIVGPSNNQRSVRDLLNDLGIELVSSDELTAVDNS